MRRSLSLFTIVTAGLLSGCSTSAKLQHSHSLVDSRLISMPADQIAAFTKQHASSARVCVQTDVDLGKAHSQGFGASYGNVGVHESGNTAEAVLGGRSAAVLITRELLYRACELSLNLNMDTQSTLDFYLKALEVVKAIATHQAVSGTPPKTVNAEANDSGTQQP